MEEIFVPASGMAMEDVLFTEWLKQPGDDVAEGEPIAVVETDKAVVELSGTTAGRLSHHLVQAGSRVAGGTTVAYLLAAGEEPPGASSTPATPSASTGEERPTDAAVTSITGRHADGRHTLSPRQRRAMAAAANGGDVQAGDGTGQGIDHGPAAPPAAVAAPPAAVATGPAAPAPLAAAPAAADRSAEPLGNRAATAALVTESWRTVPHFSVGRDVRVDGLMAAVQTARGAGAAVTVTDFLVAGLAWALESVGEPPDVGLAVATEWGVLIPVLRSLAGRSLRDVAALRQAAVNRARARRLGSSDTAPAFATLSNLGPSKVTWFTGVVPVGHVALLTVGEVSLRPAVEDGALVVAPMLTAVVTADHRRYDGTDSARLLDGFCRGLADAIAGAPT
jgi:pyruvate dehydrogenase E2 component (dihydrolipoamide acetyltransferase)